ncbi:MAG: hypothetical protein WCD76_08870, partial [Pyrinomonadaceae bacterium]
MRRHTETMKALLKILATAMTCCVLAASTLAFDAQKNDPKPPPPKDPKEVPHVEKPPPPPPRNDNKGGGNENKRGKP